MKKKEFKINAFLSVRLEEGQTNLYVNGKRFLQCSMLVLQIPKNQITQYENINSIDEAARLNATLYRNEPLGAPHEVNISTEEEFWGHCSNLQAWYEHGYDTRLIHSNLGFPLLRKLAEEGAPLAKDRFKEELEKRIKSGNIIGINFLLEQSYLDIFSDTEKAQLFEGFEYWKHPNIYTESSLRIYHILSSLIGGTEKSKFKEYLVEGILNGYFPQLKRYLRSGFFRDFTHEEMEPLIEALRNKTLWSQRESERLVLWACLAAIGGEKSRRQLRKNLIEELESNELFFDDFIWNKLILPLLGPCEREKLGIGYIEIKVERIISATKRVYFYRGRLDLSLKGNFSFSSRSETFYSLVRSLDLSNMGLKMGLKCLPDWVLRLDSLTHLNLKGNPMKELPESFGRLTNLESLDLSCCQLEVLPESFGRLTNLESLDLSCCQLEVLPESFGDLTSLEWVDLSSNNLKTLPDKFCNLHNLLFLDLSSNKLGTLPEMIGELESLTELDLGNRWLLLGRNKLSSLPDSLFTITSLKRLTLRRVNLKSTPSRMGALRNLEYLDISENFMLKLPNEIGELNCLRVLDLSDTNLRELDPSMLQGLTSLKELYLNSNALRALPDEIGGLKDLETLHLRKNKLRALPRSFVNLKALKELCLSKNRFSKVPNELRGLASLKKLKMSHNKLSSIPEFIGYLPSLEYLDFIKNNISDLPKSLITRGIDRKICLDKNEGTVLIKSVSEKMKSRVDFYLKEPLLERWIKRVKLWWEYHKEKKEKNLPVDLSKSLNELLMDEGI